MQVPQRSELFLSPSKWLKTTLISCDRDRGCDPVSLQPAKLKLNGFNRRAKRARKWFGKCYIWVKRLHYLSQRETGSHSVSVPTNVTSSYVAIGNGQYRDAVNPGTGVLSGLERYAKHGAGVICGSGVSEQMEMYRCFKNKHWSF